MERNPALNTVFFFFIMEKKCRIIYEMLKIILIWMIFRRSCSLLLIPPPPPLNWTPPPPRAGVRPSLWSWTLRSAEKVISTWPLRFPSFQSIVCFKSIGEMFPRRSWGLDGRRTLISVKLAAWVPHPYSRCWRPAAGPPESRGRFLARVLTRLLIPKPDRRDSTQHFVFT